jgi:hypothetical protein
MKAFTEEPQILGQVAGEQKYAVLAMEGVM